ncbi:Cys-tRNA(Pro) deacylase [Nakamurella leprariae]|uniref:Cys-tRNA(Pro)/Cys-tRNA(Cys) deacylase n=1 Tax=Nakamurella leprariae TaxID=2803911 RepID=A0A938YI32_9ACTN|nr:Cys-tRNA(Pro) deacylase [Nakamurella leprariae]MBM9468200.1 Cys-tRNA(Pro) deacylase [Nakamurella leprariae]
MARRTERSNHAGRSAATPALVALTAAGVDFTVHPYDHDPTTTTFGDEVVAALDLDPTRVFKTLVAKVDDRSLVVGIVPVSRQLDLKALAAAVGGKRAVMAPVAEAERSSGYVAGGISPLGHRKPVPTVIDASAVEFPTVWVSAGRRGLQVELAPNDLLRVAGALLAPIAIG